MSFVEYSAAAALLVLVVLWALLSGTRKRLTKLEAALDDQRRKSSGKEADGEELKESLEGLRKLVALMAAGKPVDAEMIKENRLFRNATTAEILAELEAGRQPYVVDVRTSQEWTGGHIECALHMPVDEIPKRMHELARDGRKMYLICASGGRSAAAAELLSNRGYLNVHNVSGGMGAWRGKVAKG
ncbi:MAG: rhodanese-like domain-containing protein [Planctomycetota bacterium]